MQYFTRINSLPIIEMKKELLDMISSGILDFDRDRQICLNSTPDKPDDMFYGSGSLTHDHKNAYIAERDDGVKISVVPKFEVPLKESDFNTLCSQFKGTVFEEVYNMLNDRFNIGRVRLMQLPSRKCMSWHADSTDRLHCPIITDTGCMMVIDDELLHMKENEWWLTHTMNTNHTAFNASMIERYHLVTVIQ